ncbi:MAG TPA: DUF4185 domain-containing protein [Bryobacteraceae bacterium]
MKTAGPRATCFLAVIAGFVASLGLASAAQSDDNFFPYSQGWLGGDSAYSIPLDSTSTLWLFGDTFVGTANTTHRNKSSIMIHNSIAIRKCNGDCRTTYWWSGMYTPHPKSFFKTADSDYYWPLDGFVYDGKLYIFWEQMHNTGKGGAFGFDYSGVTLFTISNYLASPGNWHISYRTVVNGNQIIPSISATALSDYAYIFTLFRQSVRNPFLGLVRIPLSNLSSGNDALRWEYLNANSHWVTWNSRRYPSDALALIQGNITEMSLSFHSDLHAWLAIYPTPGFLYTTASYSTAKSLDNTWTKARPIFSYPEMRSSDPRHTPNVFCYAAKEHPELESKEQLALTYACNSTKEAEIMRDMRLYRPELVIKPLADIKN